ncbi:MAG: methyltransferase [Dongiaceae bacterium]
MTTSPDVATTVDAFLGGLVEAVQPDDGGHRSGLEAVLIAAAIETDFDGTLVDLGAGSGIAGMCVAARCPGASVVLVERDRDAVAAARATLARPANRAFAGRVSIVATDIGAPESQRLADGLGRDFADAVILNPPFYDPDGGTLSSHPLRADAHVIGGGGLEPWFRTAASVLRPGGRVVAIFRADGIGDLLAALAGRFGAAAILPIHPRANQPAHRVLVRAVKGSRGRPALLPGLTLHGEAGGAYLPPVEAILRDGTSLADAHPARASGRPG